MIRPPVPDPEISRLRAQVELLVRGLTLQAGTLGLMNDKLDRLIDLATTPADNSLSDLLRQLIEQNSVILEMQREILLCLRVKPC